MTTTLPPTNPTRTNRQPQWLLASLATAAFAIVLAGCGAPTTGPVGSRPTIPPCSGVDTAEHGCISATEFESRRDRIAQQHLVDPEYQEQPALERINAHQAHASLEVVHGSGTKPGEGVTIGVIDSGVDLNHPELAAANIEEFLLQGVPDEIMNDPRGFSHGTAVTSVIAAQPNGKDFIGVAWGADFKVFAVAARGSSPSSSYPAGYDPTTFDWVEAYRTVLASGVDIVNASYYAVGTFVENYTAAEIRAALPQLQVVAQQGVTDPTIFVRITGNDHGTPCSPQSAENCVADPSDPTTGRYDATSPSALGGAVALLEELQGHNVVVAALAEDGTIAGFSNRCGIAADWCIAAPGSGISGAYFGPQGTGIAEVGGTSVAAPLVTGGLALMKQLFRDQLSHRELVTRLFRTADKRGLYADSATYGQGAMDLEAAVSPVGSPLVRLGSLAGPGPSIQATRLRLGSALGDGFSRSAAGLELAAFDELGAPFWFGLSSLTDLASTPSSLERLRELMAPERSANSLLDLAGATTLARVQPRPFGVRIGWLGEGETLLGSKAAGAFGRLSANTLIGGFELQLQAGGWDLAAAAELGWTLAEYGGGIITDLSGLTSTSFSLHATRQLTGTDRLTLSLSQPPRLEQGLASLNLPIGRTQGGRVRYRSVAAELTPSGRELNLAAGWQREQLLGGTFRAELGLASDPGHLETEPIFSLAAGWQVVF